MEDLNIWVSRVQDLLSRLADVDMGYPLGTNTVLPPQQPSVVEKALRVARASQYEELKAFFTTCDGVSLPDVHVGYFIKSVTQLGIVDRSSEPVEIKGQFAGTVLPFGSTGGGGLFVLCRVTHGVLHLAPGPLDNGVYDGTHERVKHIAGSFVRFLERLSGDIEAFVENRTYHRFMC